MPSFNAMPAPRWPTASPGDELRRRVVVLDRPDALARVDEGADAGGGGVMKLNGERLVPFNRGVAGDLNRHGPAGLARENVTSVSATAVVALAIAVPFAVLAQHGDRHRARGGQRHGKR